MVSKSNRPLFDFEPPLWEDVASEPNTLKDRGLDLSLLGDTPMEPEIIPPVDEDLVVPSRLFCEGGWVDALLLKGAPNGLPPGKSVGF